MLKHDSSPRIFKISDGVLDLWTGRRDNIESRTPRPRDLRFKYGQKG